MTPTEAQPGSKYYKFRVYQRGRMFPLVVWDGIRDYENFPPPNLLIAENLTGRMAIAQVRRADASLIDALINGFDSGILWARDHKAYRRIVAAIEGYSQGRLQ